jgi:hypothetical protein
MTISEAGEGLMWVTLIAGVLFGITQGWNPLTTGAAIAFAVFVIYQVTR